MKVFFCINISEGNIDLIFVIEPSDIVILHMAFE